MSGSCLPGSGQDETTLILIPPTPWKLLAPSNGSPRLSAQQGAWARATDPQPSQAATLRSSQVLPDCWLTNMLAPQAAPHVAVASPETQQAWARARSSAGRRAAVGCRGVPYHRCVQGPRCRYRCWSLRPGHSRTSPQRGPSLPLWIFGDSKYGTP